jgi:ABC-type transport system involved in multi-copper enzyme maturation permease subunit
MSALLQAELLKLRTTRTFFALMGAALGLSLLLAVLTLVLSDPIPEEDMRDVLSGDFTSLFILLLGVIGMSGEWRHRTITSTVLAAPDRVRLLAAKVIAYAVAGAVLSLVVNLVTFLVGTILAGPYDHEALGAGDLLDLLWRNVAVAALMGALGVCVGAVVRNQLVAMIGLIFFSFFVETAVFALAPEVGRFAPTTAPTGIQAVDFFEDGDHEFLDPLPAAAVTLAWIGLLFALGAALLRKRDLT